MSALANSFVSVRNHQSPYMPGSSLVQVDKCLSSSNVFMSPTSQGKRKSLKYRRPLTVQASRDDGRPSGASIFVGGFVLGGIVVGALGCVYAPQLSKALAGVDRKDLMRKLPKFIYDEEKALERTRKILTEKIAQLNSAIDEVSSQLRGGADEEDAPNGASVTQDKLGASV
ncbi:hypothetical protein LguiA_005575 [Lonicera macranthoides]